MRIGAAALALPMLVAAACDAGTPASDRPPTKIVNPHHDELVALPDELRRLGVMRAIRDNGRRCQRVDAAAYQQDYRQMAMWVARCNDGREWALFIAPNGDTQLRECEHAQTLGLPSCRALAESDGPEGEGGPG